MMPCSARYLVTIAAGMPGSANVPSRFSPGRDHRRLDRVQHVEAGRDLLEAVPGVAGLQHPVLARADAFGREVIGPPDLEPPAATFVRPELRVDLAHRAAEFERFRDRLLDQRGAARRLHHRGRDIARGDDRVLRRGRRVHQERFIEHEAIELLGLRILDQDLRGLRQTRQHLVRRLRRKDHRRTVAWPRRPPADGMHVAVVRVERGMRQPGFVEVQRVDLAVEQRLYGLDVVEDAVVGALRQCEHARLVARRRVPRAPGCTGALDQRMALDLLRDRLPLELFQRNRADDPVVIARRRQEHRDRAGHRDRMQDRLVAIAVDDHHVARSHDVVPDDLVRRRRAVGDEEQMIGAEDARGVAFARRHRPGVVEQLPEFVHRIADVRPQHVLAEELVEHLADRALQECHAARVARAVPRVRTVLRVVDQRAEKWRRQCVEVGARLAHDVARDELGRVLEHVDEAVQFAQHLVRQVLRRARFAVQEDRNVRVSAADLAHERQKLGDGFLVPVAFRQFLVVHRQDESRRAALLLREARDIAEAGDAERLDAFGFDRLGQRADAEAARVLGTKVLVDDHNGEAEAHAWPVVPEVGEGRERIIPARGAPAIDVPQPTQALLRIFTLNSAMDGSTARSAAR